MRRSYDVQCQDAAGKTVTVVVRATTDERACDLALKQLNSWRVLHAVPAAGAETGGTPR